MITAQFDLRFKIFILFSLFLLIEGFFFTIHINFRTYASIILLFQLSVPALFLKKVQMGLILLCGVKMG